MSGPLAFVDCETTGLDPERHHIWECAIIADEHEHVFTFDVSLYNADPNALRLTHFYERIKDAKFIGTTPGAEKIAQLLAGRHIVGAVPSFDAAFLAPFLLNHKQCPAWHYHLIDVEALAAGWLSGTFTAIQEVGKNPEADGPTQEEAMRALPPWDSEKLSEAVGVNPTLLDDRHTALGDARWAKAIYEAVL